MSATMTEATSPIADFLSELGDLCMRRQGHPSLNSAWEILFTFIDEPPVDGWHNWRRGPQARFIVTVTDKTRADELTEARYADGTPADPTTLTP